MKKKGDLLLHPVRMRIIQTLMNRNLTPNDIADRLPDVPQASLYRHLAKLTQGEVVRVVEERQVRGAVEKIYALNLPAANIGPDDLRQASRNDLLGYFTTFVASLLGDYSRYLERDKFDFVADGVSFRQAAIYLTDDEFMRLSYELGAVLMKALANPPGQGRRRWMWSFITMPVDEQPPPEPGPAEGI